MLQNLFVLMTSTLPCLAHSRKSDEKICWFLDTFSVPACLREEVLLW
jgi:hypothetical protein